MTREEFRTLVEKKVLVLDGATGSNLFTRGMPKGICPERWILEHKHILVQLQREYVQAGCDVLYAPTFGGNRIKFTEYGLEEKIREMNLELVQLSKQAIVESRTHRRILVAGNLTMTGEQLYPIGSLSFEELVEVYKEQVRYLVEAGVDLIVVETMMSLNECRAAVLAVKETCELPVMVTMTFKDDQRTFYGTDPVTAIVVLQAMGVDAVGANCSTGPDKMVEIIRRMKEYANVPLIAKPNAGLPRLIHGETQYDLDPKAYAEDMLELLRAGANIVGGCCGTTPKHMHMLCERIPLKVPNSIHKSGIRALTSERTTRFIDLDSQFLMVGERINPTGKKELQAQLREGNLELVEDMAMEQVKQGAAILDINMGMNGIDEKEMMVNAIHEVTRVVDVPISIDSSHVEVIEAALRIYPGRALINSICLEEDKMKRLLSLAKKYGAMFILLPLSSKGLPKDMEEKKQIIHTVLEAAYDIGLTKEDIIVDGLVTTVGANKRAAMETIETIRYCKEELSLATIVGLSNISFGLPERQFINSTFLAVAIQAGLTMAISNPAQDLLVNTAFAADLLFGREDADVRYIHRVNKQHVVITTKDMIEEPVKKENTLEISDEKESSQVYQSVIKGNRKHILSFVDGELARGVTAEQLINTLLIPAITKVGELFEQQIYFLPQLISSAEAMRIAIDYLEPKLERKATDQTLGTIVIATVAGDIHDIGKNLVALMLKNYGFDVTDLGKDVPSEHIIEIAKEKDADIIALSALMTTTMVEMKTVVDLVKEAGLRAKVIIGGAVITPSYASQIEADGYSKDANEAVLLVKRLLQVKE